MLIAISGKRERDVQLTDEEPRVWLVTALKSCNSSPKGWPSGTSYSVDRLSALTCDSQRDGQETASALSTLGQGSLIPTLLGGWVIFPGLLLTEAALVTMVQASATWLRCCSGYFSKGSHHLPKPKVPGGAIQHQHFHIHGRCLSANTVSEPVVGSVQTGLGNLMEGYY